jgi:hypothetical protein
MLRVIDFLRIGLTLVEAVAALVQRNNLQINSHSILTFCSIVRCNLTCYSDRNSLLAIASQRFVKMGCMFYDH